jgi:hypothetical protein
MVKNYRIKKGPRRCKISVVGMRNLLGPGRIRNNLSGSVSDLFHIKTVNFISLKSGQNRHKAASGCTAQRLSTITSNVNMNAAEEKIRFRFPLH